jgi:hypothetical protein
MALPNDLIKLAARAQDAETRTADAAGKARTDLEREVSSARASTEAQAEWLRETAPAYEAKVVQWWTEVRRSWNEHVAKAHEDVDTRRAEHDVKKAKRKADHAEGYAAFAIDLAYSAIVEAEYATLDAVLARFDAEQVAQERQSQTLTGTPS